MWTLSDAELNLLEKSLCSTDDVDRSTAMLAELSGLPPELLLSIDTQPLTEFYTDDLSDTDDGASVMVHSESTMTVVAQPVSADADDTATALSDTSSSSSSVVLTDAEARRLQHSKSWPQSADGRHSASTSLDGVITSAVTVYGNQQFNFNLPHNTSTEQLHSDPRAAATAESGRFADHSIIYLSSPTSSVSDEPQIAYITDELCRIFCTDTMSLEDDDDDVEVSADVAPDTGAMELSSASADNEVSVSVQQQCLQVISCDCDERMAGSNEAPSLSLTLNTSELSADTLTASSYVEPALSSSTTELPSTSADSPTDDTCSSHDAKQTSTNDGEDAVAAEDVAIAMLQESCNNVSESTESGDVMLTSHPAADGGTSVDQSLHSKQSSSAPVIESEAAIMDDDKCCSSSHGCNASTATRSNVELAHDHERFVTCQRIYIFQKVHKVIKPT